MLCRNGVCASAGFAPATPGSDAAIPSLRAEVRAGYGRATVIAGQEAIERPGLTVVWSFTDEAKDGDHYRIEIVDASGGSTVLFDEPVSYTTSVRPNGEDCAPVCRLASVKRFTSKPDGGP